MADVHNKEREEDKADEVEEEVACEGEAQSGDEDLGEDSSFAFPMATVVRQVKKRTHNKMISSKVKVAMNEFLGEVVGSVAGEMGKTRYSMVEMDDFHRATKPYTYARELEKEKERVVAELERMKEDLESLIREFQRKFALASVDDLSVLRTDSKKDA